MNFLTFPYIVSILIALSVHEWAHGYVAYLLGDPTAKYEGRLTLNPVAHLDPMGSILFIVVGFGWGKPVPVDPRYFRNVKRDMTLTALAGPASNLVLAFLTIIIAKVLMILAIPVPTMVNDLISSMLWLNLGLMAFNLLPVAPLDGSKIIGIFVPYQYEREYQEFLYYGPFVLLGLLIAERVFHFPILLGWISLVVSPMLSVMDTIL
jgi:Zn-dependent protease